MDENVPLSGWEMGKERRFLGQCLGEYLFRSINDLSYGE